MTRNERIKQVLKESNVTRQQLADYLKVTNSTVTERLNSEKPIDSVDFINAVCLLARVPRDYIIDGIGEGDEYDHKILIKRKDPDGNWVYKLESSLQFQEELERYGSKFSDLSLPENPIEDKSFNEELEIHSIEREQELKPRRDDRLSGKNIRTVAFPVDKQGKELITYVPVRAQAGYMAGFGDGVFLEKLPAFSLPILKEGTYRMFEVNGESMLQLGGGGLHDGDIVIAQYVEDFYTIRDNRVYVIVTTDGVIVKRVLNRLKEKDNTVLVCNSDNKNGNYPAIILRPHQLLEVWELKAFISKQLSFSTDLWNMINDLQVQQALMAEKLKDMEK